MSVSEEFLANLASRAGYASGSLYSAKAAVNGLILAWGDHMPSAVRDNLIEIHKSISADINELRKREAAV